MESGEAEKKPNSFKENIGAVKDLVTTIAIIGGGLWAVYTFQALGSVNKAKLEMFRQGIVDIDLAARQVKLPNDAGLYLEIVAKIKNDGNANTYLALDAPEYSTAQAGSAKGGQSTGAGDRVSKLCVRKVDFPETGKGKMQDCLKGLGLGFSGQTLRSNATVHYPVFVKVAEPGLYHIDLSIPLSEEDLLIHQRTSGTTERSVNWVGSTSLVVDTPHDR